jgi:predicted phage-related endonuclease
MNREQFLALRRQSIGGTDCAPILGMSEYRAALAVYLEKRGLVADDDDNADYITGRYMEPPILSWYIDTFIACRQGEGIEVERTVRIVHPEHSFVAGNLDMRLSFADGHHEIIDAKSVSLFSKADWGEDGTDEVPPDPLMQAHLYLACDPLATCVKFPRLKGMRFPCNVYVVHRDDKLYETLIPILVRFWNEHVILGIPPPADFSDDKTLDALKKLFPPRPEKAAAVALPESVRLSDSWTAAVNDLMDQHGQMLRLEKIAGLRKRRVEAALRAVLGDEVAGRTANGTLLRRIFRKAHHVEAYDAAACDYLRIDRPSSYEVPSLTSGEVQKLLGESAKEEECE